MTAVNEPVRRELFMQFQMVATGHPAIDALAACYDLTGALTAFCCDTPEEAERVLRQTADDMIRDVRANWATSREQRAQSFVSFNGGRTARV
ncbi:hypothetical protein [Brevundimonas subvibrioides]|uniref:Uncharacterized protein n=1 Tax=Brevundimonas subvibrioides (strain ATCC 15264 / DSM 4735 / LMG 14903 / NBRC 16000 / CB 81) TaxID=633149 RepID=D9QFV2_BRESC|nr:hypothetical protein [Brevundimonas subvibrioides]ADL00666.1 conserved hypothetical protein [Brevundimonas subvibrioides ATCC 15264]